MQDELFLEHGTPLPVAHELYIIIHQYNIFIYVELLYLHINI